MLEEWLLYREKIQNSKDNLIGADLCSAKLMRIDLSNGNLSQADLSCAYLIRANLSGANLQDADLSDAVLSESNLTEANLEGADLTDTYLNGADLRGAKNLTCDQVEFAIIDKDTKFPDYMNIVWDADGNFECEEQP
jgi:uncharacterized protein YjbI with pentapeptide repeats